MFVILEKELRAYFASLYTYIYYALFFLVTGVYFVARCLNISSTEFGYGVLSRAFVVMVFFIPLCTMRLFAQEHKQRTDQMLFTAPVSSGSILMGKTLATVLVVFVPVVVSTIYPIVMARYGTISVSFVAASYLATIFVGLFLIFLGIFVSALCPNGILAIVITYAIYGVLVLFRVIEASISESFVRRWISELSVYDKYNNMISGIIRVKDIIFLCLFSVLFLMLTWLVLRIRLVGMKRNTVWFAATVIVFVIGILGNTQIYRMYDCTAEHVVTLSEETKQYVASIDTPTTIYYLGEENRANVTYRELLNAYKKCNHNISVVYKNVSEDAQFRQTYLSSLSGVNEASLVVASQERFVCLDSINYVSESYITEYATKTLLNIESQITSAIYYVNTEDKEKMIVLDGSGESQLPDQFRNFLLLNNYEEKCVSLEEEKDVLQNVFLDDYKVVLINGPQSDYSEEAIDELRNYLERGGNIIVTIDPLYEELPNLYQFLEEYGMSVQSGIIVEQTPNMYILDTPYYIVPQVKKTSYTKNCVKEKKRVYAMTSKGIRCVDTKNGYETTELLKTSTEAFAKVDDFENISKKGENDVMASFGIGAVSQKEGKGSVVLVSTNMFLNDEVDVEAGGANRLFFLDILNELTGETNGIMIDRKEIGTQMANYPIESKKMVQCIVMVVIPLIWIMLGVVRMIFRYRPVGNRGELANVSETEQKNNNR
ncbi:MAG: Gldg family protein [Eubacteriales bacterium]|nr:Gldg family protein [Eubacteriales bacterium]